MNESKYMVPDDPATSPADGPNRTASSREALVFKPVRVCRKTPLVYRLLEALAPDCQAISIAFQALLVILYQPVVLVPPALKTASRT
jgi:hypothetical protein